MIEYKSPFNGPKENRSENEIASITLDCCFTIHRELGPGLLESVYETCLIYELEQKGIYVEHQKYLPVTYKGMRLDAGFRTDLILDEKVVVELKAVETLNNLHFAQTLTYLKLTNCKLGLLINFNVKLMKEGVKRVVNNLEEIK